MIQKILFTCRIENVAKKWKGYKATATNHAKTISCKIHGIIGKNRVEIIEPTALEYK